MSQALPEWAQIALSLLRDFARGESPTDAEDLERKIAPFLGDFQRKRFDSVYYLACQPQAPTQTVYDKVLARYTDYAQELLDACHQVGIPVLVIKGLELAQSYFEGRGVGLAGDIDLLVPRQDCPWVKRQLFRIGFNQAYFDAEQGALVDLDIVEAAEFEANSYELADLALMDDLELEPEEIEVVRARNRSPLLFQEGKCRLRVKVDVHHTLSREMEVSDFFDTAVEGSLEHSLTLNPSDHLWYILARYYSEISRKGKRTLRELVYALALLKHESIDWDRVLILADKYHLRPNLYYTFSFLNQLAPLVPEEVLSGLDPRRGQRHRDWGWQIPVVFDWVNPLGLP